MNLYFIILWDCTSTSYFQKLKEHIILPFIRYMVLWGLWEFKIFLVKDCELTNAYLFVKEPIIILLNYERIIFVKEPLYILLRNRYFMKRKHIILVTLIMGFNLSLPWLRVVHKHIFLFLMETRLFLYLYFINNYVLWILVDNKLGFILRNSKVRILVYRYRS
jgi:hypothetical protein